MSNPRIIGPAALLALSAVGVIIADVLNPQWDWVETAVSHYVNGRAGWLIPLCLLSLGFASTWLTLRFRALGTFGVGPWLLGAWSAGVLIAALVPADPPGQWDRPPSLAGTIHGMAGLLGFTVLPAATVVLARRFASMPLWIATGVVLVAAIGYWVTFVDVLDGPSLSLAGHPTILGLAERLLLLAALVWLGILASVVEGRVTS